MNPKNIYEAEFFKKDYYSIFMRTLKTRMDLIASILLESTKLPKDIILYIIKDVRDLEEKDECIEVEYELERLVIEMINISQQDELIIELNFQRARKYSLINEHIPNKKPYLLTDEEKELCMDYNELMNLFDEFEDARRKYYSKTRPLRHYIYKNRKRFNNIKSKMSYEIYIMNHINILIPQLKLFRETPLDLN